MAKVGEGAVPSKQPDPNQNLSKSVQKFDQYLSEYDKSQKKGDKDLALSRMSNQLSLMDVAAEQAKKEMRVQEEKVKKDFEAFQKSPTKNNEGVLKHDLNTLKESMRH